MIPADLLDKERLRRILRDDTIGITFVLGFFFGVVVGVSL